MKKIYKIIVTILILGCLAFCIGYLLYGVSNDAIRITHGEKSQLKADTSNRNIVTKETEDYYLIKSNGQTLFIYHMPEGVIYDTYKIEGLYLSGEEDDLKEGVVFHSLKEVFEYLENVMS